MHTFNPAYIKVVTTVTVAILSLPGANAPIGPNQNSSHQAPAGHVAASQSFTPLTPAKSKSGGRLIRGYPTSQVGDFDSEIDHTGRVGKFSVAFGTANNSNTN